jgi:hypothetical protein
MWLFTTLGFYSVVAHRDHPDTVLIRARAREDLDALRTHHLPDLEIIENAGSDYRWRAYVERLEWEHAAAQMAADIDYPNFKDAVADRQGYERAKRYMEIWQVMHGLQDGSARS